jgi:hypothetical protein
MGGKAVVVTTEHRGVFFGYIQDYEPGQKAVRLHDARMCIHWDTSVRGVLGLASSGPSRMSRVGPAVPVIDLAAVTAIMAATDSAVSAWESAPWAP